MEFCSKSFTHVQEILKEDKLCDFVHRGHQNRLLLKVSQKSSRHPCSLNNVEIVAALALNVFSSRSSYASKKPPVNQKC